MTTDELIELERMDAATKRPVCEIAAHRAEQKWNAQADQYNQWRDLGQDEKDALIAAELWS